MVPSLQIPKSDIKPKQIPRVGHYPAQHKGSCCVPVSQLQKRESWRAPHREAPFVCSPDVAGAGSSGTVRGSTPGMGLRS